MRRPPDKDGPPVSDRDVDTSNATLNTLFGGARQKSWMVGVGAPVRPTPRTSASRTSVPQVTSAQIIAATILPSPAPSDEPSPVLPHTTVNGVQAERGRHREESRRPSSTTIAPSTHIQQPSSTDFDIQLPPTTSFEESLNQAPPAPPLSNSSPPQLNKSFTNSTGVAESPTTMTDNIPPLPSSVLLPSDRQQEVEVLAHTQTPPTQQHNFTGLNRGYPQTNSLPARPGPVRALSQGQQASRPQTQIQEASSRQTQQAQLPSPMQSNIASPQANIGVPSTSAQSGARLYPSSEAFLAQPQMEGRPHHPPPSAAPTNPRKRQRIQPAAMPSLKPRVNLIEQHIKNAGGYMNLNTGLERPRFQLLTDACNREDAFYVALHQVFCCWDVDRNQVVSIIGYPNAQALQVAFRILGQLIRENDALAPNHKKWFSEFPSPLRHLLQSSDPYRRTVTEVGTFLSRLASDWGALSNECSTRGYPPLVDELVQRMGLLSPILQGVVFTASRRNLGIRDEEIGTQMEDMFKRDQREHQALAARYNTARPPTAREVQDRNRALASEYILLHNQLIQQRQSSAVSSGSRIPTPVVPSNDYTQPGVMMSSPIPQPQQTGNQGNWNQNMPSPVAPGHQQFANALPPRLQRATDGPSNSPMVGSRPPSVGAQRGYTNTPSPTLLQGLSMHSPVQQNFPSPSLGRSNVQMRSQQAGSPQLGAHPIAPYYHNPILQQVDPATQQRVQIIEQQQHMMAQYQQQNNNQQWAQNNYIQHTPPAQQATQQQQQQQIQQELSRQVLHMNRTVQTRRDSNPVVSQLQQQQQRNNSVISNGHRPQIVHAAPALSSQLLSQAANAELYAYSQKPVLQRSLVPPLHYVHPQQPQNPDVTALHQAHIRSPRLVAAGVPYSSMSQENPATRYYQVVRGFVLAPTRISSSSPLSRFDFAIPAHDLAKAPNDILHGNGQVATREFRQGTLQYRLRCVQARRTDTKYTIADWVVADTVWPESASLAINKKQLEIRRKNHHGKDLPLDITHFVKLSAPNSTNLVTLSILKGRTKMKEFNYFLAVEIIEILRHNQILELCYNNRIPASYTLNKIKKSLVGPSGDDDDVAMVVGDLSIDLADPFTSKVFETPVRGSSCLHRECFDLEVFLMTRNSKAKRPEQPCMVDVWKCPLCGKDARPYSLQIDDFLVSVRATLQEQGELEDVKAILMDATGNWRPKVEKRKPSDDGEDSDYSSDGDGALRRASAAQKVQAKKVVEVISLDD
ncbi:uncharacterized protein LY89DRAFT_732729 [Mollisia scopiformis]|uniref:SP-RING-type domain-containing protein n=1 Tax=Mollisia scopiformis TaxID=149040 RepID=A0A194XD00_MOLSC|nr:uncharacterized protein LY89DRAFT_732729 [Mollisia scopiformis]KUJ18034.1 hypothetical protein LY89DRAFT_732729 [Mollisia scopiformis]